MKAEIKIIREIIKSENKYQDYKKTFENKKFRFLVSKILLIFSNFNLQEIAKIEKNLIANPTNEKFIETFNQITTSAHWYALGKFIFLIYKTSQYVYDMKNKKENIFLNNPIHGNEQKRIYFNNWLNSLDFSNPKTNLKVRKLLKLVF